MNDSLKKAQATYQEKCRMVNIRFNTETEKDLIDWLDIQPVVSSKIKRMIASEVKLLKEHKVIVNHYSAEVKYSGRFEDYTPEQLLEMAKHRADQGVDTFDYDEEMNQFDAMKLDGAFEVEDRYPSNKLAMVRWTYIDEETFLML